MANKTKWDFIISTARDELGVKDFTLQKWRQRGVAHWARLPLSNAAHLQNISLTAADFESPSE